MNATASRRRIRIVAGPHVGHEAEVRYAPYRFFYEGGYYERQDPPAQTDDVWWHHYAPVRVEAEESE